MTKPKSAKTKPTLGNVGYVPPLARHPQFTDATRRELAHLLGSKAAADRIESDCAFFDMRGQPTPDVSAMRDKVHGIAEASELLLRRLMAMDLEGDTWPGWLCDRPVYSDALLRRPSIWAQGEDAWGNLLTHVDALAASAGELERILAVAVKKGRPREPGLDLVGRNLVASLEREGLHRSFAEKSPMVRAVAVVFGALRFKADAREFVRSVKPGK